MNYDYASTYSITVADSLRNLYARLINFLPMFLSAVIVLIIGWVVAVFVAKLVRQVLQSIKIDELGDKLGLDELSNRTGMKLSVSGGLAWLVKWFLLLAVFLAASEILQLDQVSVFFYDILSYIPKVIAAAAIVLVGTMVAQFLTRLVRHSVAAAGLHSGELLGSITQWALMIFTVLIALDKLGIGSDFMKDLFRAIVLMLALAGGLAFGLGGKEHASKVLDKVEKDIKS